MVRPRRRLAGVEKLVNPNVLRHTRASHALERGVKATVIWDTPRGYHLEFGRLAPALGFLGHANVVPVLIIGGVLTSFIVDRFAKEAKGHGVPEVMASFALRGGIMRPRIIAVKSIASATCIGFGGSCGRKGPIIQIGATIGSLIGQTARAPAPLGVTSSTHTGARPRGAVIDEGKKVIPR